MPKDTEFVTDPDNPEWTKEKFDRSISFSELPEAMRNKLSAIQEASRKKRGLQKEPTKKLVSIRLSPDVLVALRATGPGWQTLADKTLRDHFVKSPKKRAG
jgi:uncharacterized protein (DUF4415 family)